ncbi:RNA methyltransferase, TrmH family, group 1 [Candidatus Magnetoovum chiemensis]|nr:RNA methyltransferase, TrmH family, group 1 [Candidatus Magnetoovum chiemensis]
MSKDNVFFILIEPREAGNIGASARAIKNMGFKNLELVNPRNYNDLRSYALAHRADDVLANAVIYKNIGEALYNKSLAVGLTRRLGSARGIMLTLKEGILRLFEVCQNNKVGIVFGREDNGLNNDEIEQCGFLITIPTDQAHPSLNLSQAVLIVAYELFLLFNSGYEKQLNKTELSALVEYNELSHLYDHIQRTLKLLDYSYRGDENLREGMMRNMRHLIGRYGLTGWELRMLHGICAQIEKILKKGVNVNES